MVPATDGPPGLAGPQAPVPFSRRLWRGVGRWLPVGVASRVGIIDMHRRHESESMGSPWPAASRINHPFGDRGRGRRWRPRATLCEKIDALPAPEQLRTAQLGGPGGGPAPKGV
jgi:hypothetical protein